MIRLFAKTRTPAPPTGFWIFVFDGDHQLAPASPGEFESVTNRTLHMTAQFASIPAGGYDLVIGVGPNALEVCQTDHTGPITITPGMQVLARANIDIALPARDTTSCDEIWESQ